MLGAVVVCTITASPLRGSKIIANPFNVVINFKNGYFIFKIGF